MTKKPECCLPAEKKGKGVLSGILYGLLPHTFCIAFIALSAVGAAAAAGLVRRLLLVPYLFEAMLALSFLFATLAAVLYLRRLGSLSLAGARSRWRYLSVLYGTTIAVNLLLFMVVFPAAANSVQAQPAQAVSRAAGETAATRTLEVAVALPCSGHAPLVTDALTSQDGIVHAGYFYPDRFTIEYDPAVLSSEDILQLEIFEEFPAALAE